MSQFKTFPKALFRNKDPTAASIDVALGEIRNCNRHQLVVAMLAGATAGTVAVKGIQTSSGLVPAAFDSRLDAIDMSTKGAQAFIFYGYFEALHFDFSGFGAGKKISASIISMENDLLISGNAP